MKTFKLLLKNSMKSLWNSRVLVTQFTTLTTIATIVVSSVALGNFSLRNAMARVEKESNTNGFSLEAKNVDNFASYKIIDESNKLAKSLDNIKISDATENVDIYNPLLREVTLTVGPENTPYKTYGFYDEFTNVINAPINQNPETEKWPHLVYSPQNESLSIITNITDNKYRNEISDIFTLYNDILPPSPTSVNGSQYGIFFDPSIYSFNPWTLYKTQNNDLKVNEFGIIKVNNFDKLKPGATELEIQNKEKQDTTILYNHGILNKKYSYILNTNLSFLEKDEMAKYENEMKIINSDVQETIWFDNVFSNGWKQPSRTTKFTSQNNQNDYNSFRNFIDFYYSDPWRYDKIFNHDYWTYMNSLTDKLHSFMQTSRKIILNYAIDEKTSTGLSKFFANIDNTSKNKIFDKDDEKYFNGTLEVPLIPFITLSPNVQKVSDWTLEQYFQWASNPQNYLDETKSIINVESLQNILNDSFNQLSIKTNKMLEEKLNSKVVSPEIRKDYYKEYDIDYFLRNSMELDFSKSSNFTITDAQNQSYIMSKNKYYSRDKVNNLVINEGRGLIPNKIDQDYLKLDASTTWYKWKWINLANTTTPPVGSNLTLDQYIKSEFLNDPIFFPLMNLFKQSSLNTNDVIINEYHGYLTKILDLSLMEEDLNQWKTSVSRFLDIFQWTLFSWNGSGYNIEFMKKNSMGITIDFSAIYHEPSSFMTVSSLNYSQLKNGTKAIIDSKFAEQAINLPFKSRTLTQDDIINNLSAYQNHFIYNPYTKKTEFYNDFLDWMNRLDSKFKISVNGDEFVILGKGINSEFVYPITSSNQLLINNNSPVLFMNELGYDKIAHNNTVVQQSNYFVNFKNQLDFTSLNKVNQWTKRVYNQELAYKIKDYEQPNKLLYQRMNFPYTILKVVLLITIFIAAIIVGLSLIFIFVLMRSIINQNMNTFAVGMANGISKRKMLFSFMPFVLIPSSISAILGYSFSFLLYPLISNAIQDYWILEYIKFTFSFGYFIFVFILITLIIFTVQTIVVYTLLNKNVSTLLNAKMEFKSNKLVQSSHKLFAKLKPLNSFRVTYMLGNIGRLLLLLLMMTSFVSLTTISASTLNTFNTAVQKTMDNKQYNYAIDLYSPTKQGGYYYDIPYDLLGSRQKGLTPLYDLNRENGFYNKSYKNALTYNVPNSNESIVYENLFLPSASLIGEVQGNITFFRNKIIHFATMDFGINFLGNYINPWEWAKKIIPSSLVNLVENNFQQQINYAFLYVCSIMNDEKNPDRDIWLYDKTNVDTFKQNFNNSKNPEDWDQSNWLIKLIKKDDSYIWKMNDQLLSNGLPNFTMTEPIVNLVTRLISLSKNSTYQEFIKKLEIKQNKKIMDYNYMLGLNIVPIIPDLDETYTYIESSANLNKERTNFKIYGIKPNSNQLVLWNEYNKQDLKHLLSNYKVKNDVYPLIINEVVQKKYKIKTNDIISITANNKYDRFIDKFNNIENTTSYKFKVLGVTTSKSEEQFYTTQEIANKILGFEKPKLASDKDIKGKNYDYNWVNQEEIVNYIPFNGVFSKQELPKMLTNFATLYSPSGIAPISGTLPTDENGDTYRQLFVNYSEINSILKCKFVDETKTKNFSAVMKMCQEYQRVFGNNKYYNPALYGVDLTYASALLGDVMDSTLRNINLVSIVSLLPAILIIIILMSYMIVVESRRLVALLKVLGFSNWSNTITLSTVHFVVIGLSILLGYAFSAIILAILKVFAFSAFNIIVNPIIPAWTLAVTLGTLLIIVSAIIGTIYYNLKKSNPAQEIAIR